MFLKVILFNIVLGLQLAFQVNASLCFESDEAEELAILKFKAQVICSNSNLNDCKDILLAKPPAGEDSNENLQALSCRASDSSLVHSLPTAAPRMSALLELLKFTSNATRRQYVNSVTDFHHHTQMHKKRVTRLGLELLEQFPEEFDGVDKEMAQRVLASHDNAKIDPRYRHRDGKAFYEKLYKHYGKELPRHVIDQLNAVDSKIMERALAKEGLTIFPGDTPEKKAEKIKIRRQIEKLEKLADLTDRGMNPVSSEEFGRKMWLESEAARKAGRPDLEKMSLYLEKNYAKFTGDLFYEKLPPQEYFKLSHKISTRKKYNKLLSSGRTLKEISARSLEAVARGLGSKAFTTFGKVGGRIALTAATALDGALLMLYSSSTSCSATPGHHDWSIEEGKCVPEAGLTPKFISFINLSREQRQVEYEFGEHMCSVAKENLKLNEAEVFSNVTCAPDGARMEISENNFLDVKFDSAGSVAELDLKKLKLSAGIFANPPSEVYFKNGTPEKECYRSGRGKSLRRCKKRESADDSDYLKKFSSLNYRIHQGIACCLGVQNEFSSTQTCLR